MKVMMDMDVELLDSGTDMETDMKEPLIISENITQNVTEIVTQNVTEIISEIVTENFTENSTENLPFACDLCSERFHKKLLLNNHVEKRHGIKFVFTQKGQKVKLVRMPEILHEGEKLDPCVQLLLDASDKEQRKNIIGVQAMDMPDQQVKYQSQNHQEINTQELLKNKGGLGMGVLIGNITYAAMKIAINNEETPFVAYLPHNSEKLYLLSITQMNSTRQMLLPATQSDLQDCSGVTMEKVSHFISKESTKPKASNPDMSKNPSSENMDDSELSSRCSDAGPSTDLVKQERRIYSHVAIVAILKQVMNTETEVCEFFLEPVPILNLGSVHVCDPKDFIRFGIQCKVKRLRCFSETTSLISPPPVPVAELPKPKRKYVRKNKQGDRL